MNRINQQSALNSFQADNIPQITLYKLVSNISMEKMDMSGQGKCLSSLQFFAIAILSTDTKCAQSVLDNELDTKGITCKTIIHAKY